MVVVLDLVDGVTDFQNAVNRIEFLSEWGDEETNPDDDFQRMPLAEDPRTTSEKPVWPLWRSDRSW